MIDADPTLVASTLSAVVAQFGGLVNELPPEIEGIVEALPAPATPEGAALYGGGGLLGVGGLWKAIGRFRSTSTATASAPAAAGTVVTTAEGGTPPSIKHDEAAFTLPGFLPVSKGIREVTHNEVHAIEIGLVVGFVTVWLYSIGRRNVAAGIAIAFVAGGLGFRRYKTKAVATIRMEPWYAFVTFALGAGGAYAFFLA